MSTKEFLNLTTDQLETIADILGINITHSIPENPSLHPGDPDHSELHFDMSETLEQILFDAVQDYRRTLDSCDTYGETLIQCGAYIGKY